MLRKKLGRELSASVKSKFIAWPCEEIGRPRRVES